MTNCLESPRQPQWLVAPNLFPALIRGGRQGLSLSSAHCTRQQSQCCISLFWDFLIQQAKPNLSNSNFNGIKFIWNKHQKWRNWKANVALEHLVALNSSVLLVVCCWQDKGRKTPTFPLATCFLVLEARDEDYYRSWNLHSPFLKMCWIIFNSSDPHGSLHSDKSETNCT